MLLEKAFVCRFLSLAFSYPSEGTIKELSFALPDLERSLKTLGIDFPLEKVKEVLSTDILELQGEFTSLFETSLTAPQRETSYELDKSARRSVEMADILGFYRAFGLEIKAPVEPDSLIAELEFISFLYQKEHFLKERGYEEGSKIVSEAREKFLRDHLGRWYEVFSEKVIEGAERDFYPVMAKLLRAFLDKETENIEGIQKLKNYVKEKTEGSTWECG